MRVRRRAAQLCAGGATVAVLGAAAAWALVPAGDGSRDARGEASRAAAPAKRVARLSSAATTVRVGGSRSRPLLVNAKGAPVWLRGANVNALVDYGSASTPVAVTDADFDQMAALGFNAMRLPVSWSRVMPQPGQLDDAYLGRVSGLVRAAGARGIHTVVSMHSDRYAAGLGTGTEFDGAPAWAVDGGGLPCGDPTPRYYSPCAAAAARRFYGGESAAGRPLTQWYADALVAAAGAGRAGGPGYLGVDVLNEPTDPSTTDDAVPTAAWRRQLTDLQQRLVERLRDAGERAPIWIQPQGPRSTEPARDPVLPALDDLQLVYAPHAYVDTHGTKPDGATAGRLTQQYARFEREARTLGAALVVGEFPGAIGDPWDRLRRGHLKRQTDRGIGGLAWMWKQPADGYGWGTVEPDGAPRSGTDAAAVLSGARLLAGRSGTTVRQRGDRVTVRARGRAQTVDLWLGARFGVDTPPAPRLLRRSGVKVVAQSVRTVTAGDAVYGGTVVRLRLRRGAASAAWAVPAAG